MEAYATDEQQWEAIKKWFKDRQSIIITTVLAVAIVLLGYKYWTHHTEILKISASEQYNAMMLTANQNDSVSAVAKAQSIIDDFPKTAYASLAALYLAKHEFEAGNVEQALAQLDWVIEHGSVHEFTLVARTRAARIHMDTNELDKALAILDVSDANGYASSINELKGDVFMMKNDTEQAKKAYAQAIQTLRTQSLEIPPLLELKARDLGVVMEQENA